MFFCWYMFILIADADAMLLQRFVLSAPDYHIASAGNGRLRKRSDDEKRRGRVLVGGVVLVAKICCVCARRRRRSADTSHVRICRARPNLLQG